MTEPITAAEAEARVITPVAVGNLSAFLAAVVPVAKQLMDGDILGALVKHADNVIDATAIGAGVPRERLDLSGTDTLAILAARVMEVNADFFARRLLPELTKVAERINVTFNAPLMHKLTTGSSASPKPALGTTAQ